MAERKLTAVLKFNDGRQRVLSVCDLPSEYRLFKEPKLPKMDIEEFTELTPDNIINKGGFSQILAVLPEEIIFRFRYSMLNSDGSEVGYYEES